MKKKTKFSLGMKIVTLLTVITMASVGFAAWVITAPVTAQEKAGAITVDTVSDESIVIETKWLQNYDSDASKIGSEAGQTPEVEPEIYYGAPVQNIDNAWLTNDSGKVENLVAYLYISVNNKSKSDTTVSVKLDGIIGTDNPSTTETDESKFNGNSAIDNAISAGSIGTPMLYEANTSDGNAIGTGKQYIEALQLSVDAGTAKSFVIKVEFFWGSDFEDINAYTYYNTGGYTAVKHQKAEENLGALYNNLKDLSYKVTITAA